MKDRLDEGSEETTIPLPEGACVRQFSPDLALIELDLFAPCIPDELSEAERDIAQRIFDGATNQQIAVARGVNVKTVGKQLEAIYRKLGVSCRVELILRLRP
jgi:DNA-binding NarL/FixJ family response regulator